MNRSHFEESFFNYRAEKEKKGNFSGINQKVEMNENATCEWRSVEIMPLLPFVCWPSYSITRLEIRAPFCKKNGTVITF